MEEDLKSALVDCYRWVFPKTSKELVVLSSADVIRGLCVRIGKRGGIVRFYDIPYQSSKVIYDHCQKGGHRAWIKMAFIRIRVQHHKDALSKFGLPTDGLVMLNPLTWEGWGMGATKYDYWVKYGSEWYDKMKEDAEAWEHTKEFLSNLWKGEQ